MLARRCSTRQGISEALSFTGGRGMAVSSLTTRYAALFHSIQRLPQHAGRVLRSLQCLFSGARICAECLLEILAPGARVIHVHALVEHEIPAGTVARGVEFS